MQHKFKIFLIVVAIVGCSFAHDDALEMLDKPQQQESLMLNETLSAETYGLILNARAKKFLRNIVKQMPCGWPGYGIPALAPYTNEQLKFELNNSLLETLLQLYRFRLDGLDLMEIISLKVSYTFKKKIKYHLNFKELKASALLYDINNLLKLPQLGLEIRYEGQGPLEIILNNLSVEGSFKYKAPIIIGSDKIYNFKVAVTLGSVTSNIGGIFGDGSLNDLFNKQIELIIPKLVNKHQDEISHYIENTLVARVNQKLKGKKVWTLLGLMGSSKHKCNPTPAPWLLERETKD